MPATAIQPSQIQEVFKMKQAGLSDRQIAEVIHCSPSTVFNFRMRHGIPANPGPTPPAAPHIVEITPAQLAIVTGIQYYARAMLRPTQIHLARWTGRRYRDLGPDLDALEDLGIITTHPRGYLETVEGVRIYVNMEAK